MPPAHLPDQPSPGPKLASILFNGRVVVGEENAWCTSQLPLKFTQSWCCNLNFSLNEKTSYAFRLAFAASIQSIVVNVLSLAILCLCFPLHYQNPHGKIKISSIAIKTLSATFTFTNFSFISAVSMLNKYDGFRSCLDGQVANQMGLHLMRSLLLSWCLSSLELFEPFEPSVL